MPVSYAIDIVELSKVFKRQTLSRGSYTTIKSWLLGRSPDVVSQAVVTRAVSKLTMRVPQGDSLGVIGRNGSGKSTLLKLITGIYRPTTGTIAVNGKIAALIELGAGFHPDFTGRENLELAAVMMGLSRKQIAARFDEIVSFAELESVIDDPVRTYSSGMFMRLGFSVAVHTEPDVLLIDEVLSVGDVGFVRKCRDKLQQLKDRGTTLLMVSHDLDSIERFSDEVLWLHQGHVKDRGEPRRVIDAYRQFVENDGKDNQQVNELQNNSVDQNPQRWGSREIQIDSVEIAGAKTTFAPQDALTIDIRYSVTQASMIHPLSAHPGADLSPELDLAFGVGISTKEGHLVFGTNSHIERFAVKGIGQGGIVQITIPHLSLREGEYLLDVAVHRHDGYPYDYRKAIVAFSVRSATSAAGVYYPAVEWKLVSNGGSR